ncbi:ankyrin repeat-containing domain protein [Aspergillus pseudodeflectus]|uniref:Ankyrin repeat-containing domain protein n=1 Tax=Aspergillus pseudodeflectus TaxID=176178 RepID=A0ABR4KRU2_9EURO
MLPHLYELPLELRDEIWAFITSNSAQDMNAFVQTCRRFYDRYNSDLYQYAVRHMPSRSSAWAEKNGQLTTMKKLIEAGLDLNQYFQVHPLCIAALHARVEIVEYLLHEQKVNRWEMMGAPLAAAIQGSDVRIVRMIVAAMKKDSPTTEGLHTRLGIEGMDTAVYTGSVESARLLLDEGVDVNFVQPYSDTTPLISAIMNNRSAVMELLLDRGALLEDSDAYRANLLRIAITGNHVEGARILLERGISRLDAGTLAIAAGKSEEMAELLLSQGADPNSKGYDFPILNAIRSGLEKVVEC